jgi:hypothetical protein
MKSKNTIAALQTEADEIRTRIERDRKRFATIQEKSEHSNRLPTLRKWSAFLTGRLLLMGLQRHGYAASVRP